MTVPPEDVTPYSRVQLVAAILGAIFGTGIVLLCIFYFLRRRPNSRYTPVRGEQDTAAEEFNFRPRRDSEPNQDQLNLGPITSSTQNSSHPTRDTALSSALYPTWSSAASSSRARNNPRIIVTSPTVPSSIESHIKSMYDPQHHLASSTPEDTAYTGLPPRPSSPIPNGYAKSGYLPVETSDEEEVDLTHYPAARSDALNLKKMKHGTLPATPTSTSDTPPPRVELRAPLLQTDLASQSTRPRESQPQPQSQTQTRIHLNLQAPPEPPKPKSLAPIIVPPPFPPPSHPPPKFPAVENISAAPFDGPWSASRNNNQPPGVPVWPATAEVGANTSLKSQTSDADQHATNLSAILTSPSTSYQVKPRPMAKTTDVTDRGQTWYSNIESTTTSHQYSMDSPLPSSRALSHGPHGDKKDPATNSNSPVKSLSPESITPSTGGPTPSSWEFPLPPGAPPLQHTRSDPSPPASAARPPRPRTKSTLSNVVATATDIQVNREVGIPMVSMAPARPMTEGLRSDSPNGAISKGSKGGLMTAEPQVRARKPITPDFFDSPEAEQKTSKSWTDMHEERVERDVSGLSGIPMILAGSLKESGSSTERQADQPTANPTRHRRESSFAYRESSNSHTSFVTDDDNETLERAEIKTAEVAIRSPPTNVPELARWDTIHQMSDAEERFHARSRSGSNATATESMRKRKSPDDSPPPMPRVPMDAKERQGDSLDLSSRGTSIVEGQLATIPMSLGDRMSPLVPWTPSPAATPLRLETVIHSASPQYITFDSSGRPPWQPLRLSCPPRDEQRSPSTPPSVPPIPELAPISFDDLMAPPPVQETVESPALVEEQTSQADPTIVTVHEASPRVSTEANESVWQPGHASDSSIHSQGTADTFGLSAAKSMRGVPRRGPRAMPHDREPSGSGASIASMSHQHTGSHGTSGSGSHNDGYAPAVDYIFGLPPPVLEQPEPDGSSESHVTVPAPHKLSPKVGPIEFMTPTSPPTSANGLPQTNIETPLSSSTSVALTMSGLITRPRAGSTRAGVGVVRGPRDRSSSARAVLSSPSSGSCYSTNQSLPLSSSSVPASHPQPSSSVRAVISSPSSVSCYSTNQSLPLASPSVPASHLQPPTLTPDNASGSPKPKTDSTISNNSLLDLYAQSPPRPHVSISDSPSLLSNGHPQSHPS